MAEAYTLFGLQVVVARLYLGTVYRTWARFEELSRRHRKKYLRDSPN